MGKTLNARCLEGDDALPSLKRIEDSLLHKSWVERAINIVASENKIFPFSQLENSKNHLLHELQQIK